jgi:hypothetical protein
LERADGVGQGLGVGEDDGGAVVVLCREKNTGEEGEVVSGCGGGAPTLRGRLAMMAMMIERMMMKMMVRVRRGELGDVAAHREKERRKR